MTIPSISATTPAIVGNIGDRHPTRIPTDGEILALWRAGYDTLAIARALGVPQSYIANKLPKVLERSRQDEAWDRTGTG